MYEAFWASGPAHDLSALTEGIKWMYQVDVLSSGCIKRMYEAFWASGPAHDLSALTEGIKWMYYQADVLIDTGIKRSY